MSFYLGGICTPNLRTVAKGDFCLLGVLVRLLSECKVLDVVSFLRFLQIIFSKSHSAPPLKVRWISPVN